MARQSLAEWIRLFSSCVALLWTLTLLFPGSCCADDITDLLGRNIRRIEYQAELPIDRSRYDLLIGLKIGDDLTRSGVKKALQALYDTGRFSSMAAEVSPDGDGVALVFRLNLTYYFNRFVIRGAPDVRGRAPWEVLALPVGERFTSKRLEDVQRMVQDYMKEQGYFQSVVKLRSESDFQKHQVDVYLDVAAGRQPRVRSVTVTGVPPFEEREIRSKLGAAAGKKYSRRRVMRRLDSIRESLAARGYFTALPQFSESYETSDNTIALTVNVANFGRDRIRIDGFKVEKSRLRQMLPLLSGERTESDSHEDGLQALKSYLIENGYPDAGVEVKEERDKHDTRMVRYIVQAGRKVTIAYVRFQGNRALSDGDLQAVLQLQPGRLGRKTAFNKSMLDSDVDSLRALYDLHGYLEAKITAQTEMLKDASGLGITFHCEEGRFSRAKSVGLSGNESIASSVLSPKMQLKEGGPYSPQIAERDRQALLAAYNDAGFLQVRVSYHAGEPDKSGAYPVEFKIEESIQSRIDQVIVLGNHRTRESLIQKKIHLRANDPLSLGKMLETQQALYNIGVFDRVKVAPQNPDSVTPFQNVIIRLDEAKRFTVRYGLGYQEREKVRGTIELSQLNILGTGQRADLRLRASGIEQLAALNFQQPQFRFLPVNSYLTLSAQKKQEVSYDVTRFNFSYQYSYELNTHSWGLLRYGFRRVRVFNSQVEPAREDTPRTLSTISAIYINDTRDNYLDPEKGFFTSTDLSLTTRLLGSNSYYSLFSQNSYYRKLRGSMSTAVSLRFGLAVPFGRDTDLPISERFFAGGASSLRGFDIDKAGPLDPDTFAPTGGNALFVGNLELRTPPWHSLFLAGFYDTGNVFRYLGDFSLSQFSHTLGVGIRIKTPFGPLRADYGFNLNLPAQLREHGFKTGHFFITIGPPF